MGQGLGQQDAQPLLPVCGAVPVCGGGGSDDRARLRVGDHQSFVAQEVVGLGDGGRVDGEGRGERAYGGEAVARAQLGSRDALDDAVADLLIDRGGGEWVDLDVYEELPSVLFVWVIVGQIVVLALTTLISPFLYGLKRRSKGEMSVVSDEE